MPSIKRLTFRRAATISLLALFSVAPAYPWGQQGHRLVARVGAARLTAHAREHVAALLGVDATDIDALADAMADASTWADDIKRTAEGSCTSDWHYLDLASDDTKAQIAQRCPNGDCITAKLAEIRDALKAQKDFPVKCHDFVAADELRFLIHFMGDIHQPLHSATNADAGGNCLHTKGYGANELHAAWDGGLVKALFTVDGKTLDEAGLARSLNQKYAAQRKLFIATTDFQDMALESRSIAFESAYGPLLSLLPGEEPRPFLDVPAGSCKGAEDFKKLNPPVDLTTVYDDATLDIVSEQIAKGGYRLAALLNAMFKQ